MLRLSPLGARRPVIALGMEHEHLDGLPVSLRVDAALERAHLAPRDLLDRLAEFPDRGVLEEHARVAQALVLAHLHEVALGRGQRLLQHTDYGVRTGPVRPSPRGAAAEQLLVEP